MKIYYSNIEILDLIKSSDRDKNNKALKYIYRSYFADVLKVIRKFGGNKEIVNEVFQDSLIILYENIKTNKFKEESSLKTYLLSVAKYNYLSKLREKRKYQFGDFGELLPDDERYIEEMQDTREKNIEDAIELLFTEIGDQCKQLLKFFYYEKMPHKDIVKKLNFSSIQTAKTRKAQCMKKLIEIVNTKPGLKKHLMEIRETA